MDQSHVEEQRPNAIEWVALVVLFLAAVALSLIRVDMTDTPWHLATARLAFASGHWPVTNTFSYTYPEYPLNQQYPVYQTLLYLVYSVGKWEGLSILNCILWVAIFVLWMLWGGSIRRASLLNAAWLVGLLGLQQRMILRPDIMTMLLLVLLLHMVDSYRKGRTWMAGFFIPLQLVMVNSHQLFPLGLGVQGALLVHLGIVRGWAGRWGISQEDKQLPMLPVLLALGGSLLACLGTPLGIDIIQVASHTLSSLTSHREHVQEFAPFYTSPHAVVLVVLATALAVSGFWHRRKCWQPFEVFLWMIGIALCAAAIRGMAFYVVMSVGIFARSYGNADESFITSCTGRMMNTAKQLWRPVCLGITVAVCLFIFNVRWGSPPRILGGTQPGIGLAWGVWPYPAIRFIREFPPPGRMLNIPWYSGNPLIWELYPAHRIFVDPRFESYPRSFLTEAIRADTDQAILENLIGEYQPNWIVGWIGDRDVRQRLANLVLGNEWSLVHVDTVFVILVRNTPGNEAYLARHRIAPENIVPSGFLESEPDLLALQEIRMASFYQDLGLTKESEEMVRKAEPAASRFSEVRDALAGFSKEYPH